MHDPAELRLDPPARGAPGPGLVVAGLPVQAVERLAAAGYAVLVPDLSTASGEREAVARLEEAAARLAADPAVDPERIAAVGFGVGGTRAFLLGCQSRRLAAVVDLFGRVRYAALDAAHPVQPLEMSLNLSCPLLAVFGDAGPAVPRGEVLELRERLAAFAKPAEVVVVSGDASDLLGSPAWDRTLTFLDEALAP